MLTPYLRQTTLDHDLEGVIDPPDDELEDMYDYADDLFGGDEADDRYDDSRG